MNREDIALGLKMVAMGRLNHPAADALCDALAVVLANPEERLAMTVQDSPTVTYVEVTPETLPAHVATVLKGKKAK